MENVRIYYTKEGWLIDTPFGLNQRMLNIAIEYHKKIQSDRIKGMRGDKRIECGKALSILSIKTIRQNILPNKYNEKIIIGAN